MLEVFYVLGPDSCRSARTTFACEDRNILALEVLQPIHHGGVL